MSGLSHSRKEVFQPHLPVRLPCYDLAPVTGFTLGRSLRLRTLGTPSFHGLTGGVYKARERIHRVIADTRLLANPTSRGRVADPDPNCEQPIGFPHSEITGSSLICRSPALIAAYHVLHRLREPRHPPCTLSYFLPIMRLLRRMSCFLICRIATTSLLLFALLF